MEKYFVESHAGGFYFSSEDPSIIEGYGEDSGNGDTIIFSFDDEIEDEPYNSFEKYLSRDLFFTHEELMKKLEDNMVEQLGVYPALDAIAIESIYYIDRQKQFILSLLKDGKIDTEMYKKLEEFLSMKLQSELDFIKSTNGIGLTMSIENKKRINKQKVKEK